MADLKTPPNVTDDKVDSSLAGTKDPGLNILLDAEVSTGEGQTIDFHENKKLLRKLDMVLMPLIIGTWLVQCLDKATLGTAAIFNIIEDANLVKNQFSWLSSLFYVGWIVWEYPSNLLLQRFPVAKTLAITVIAWGAVLMCHAAGHNFGSLAAVRVFLGALEAGCNPACMILFGMFYTREEQPLRMGIWIGFGGVANILSGIIGYGIGHVTGPLSVWKVMYLVYGGFTVLWGAILWLCLPDSPMKARFLKGHERKAVILRIASNGAGVGNKQWKKQQFIEAIKDVKSWLFFALSLVINAPTGVFMNFQGLIIKSLGYSGLQTTLMTMPSGAFWLVGCTGASYFATRYKNLRIAMSLVFILPFFAGIVGLRVLDDSNPWGRLVSLWLCFFFASPYGIGMALVNANTAGHTKRITTNAMFIIGAGIGSFIGPFFFDSRQAPYYTLGFNFMFATFSIEVVVLAALFYVLWSRNKAKRIARGGRDADAWAGKQSGFMDETDIENKNFVYVY